MGNKGRRQIAAGGKCSLLGGDKIEPQRGRAAAGFFALQRIDGAAEHFAVKVEPHRDDVSALLRAEQVAGSTDFEIAHGDFETRAEFGILLDRRDALAGGSDGHQFTRQKQKRVGFCARAPDTAAELVEVG